MCFGALGTDTGGSIRIPSAACGMVGLKATIGEISCEGVVPLSTSFDHLGPMARTVADAALLFDVLTGRPRSSDMRRRLRWRQARSSLAFRGPISAIVSTPAWSRLERRAAACVTLDIRSRTLRSILPGRRRMSTCTSCCPRHAVSRAMLERYAPTIRRASASAEMGRYLLAEDYARAMRLRAALTRAVDRALDDCDALLLPTLPIRRRRIGATTVDIAGGEPIRAAMLRLTPALQHDRAIRRLALPAAADATPPAARHRRSCRRHAATALPRSDAAARSISAAAEMRAADVLSRAFTRGSDGSRRSPPIASCARSSGDSSGSDGAAIHGRPADARLQAGLTAMVAASDEFFAVRRLRRCYARRRRG